MGDISRYLEIRDSLQTGDLVEFQGKSIISRLIRWRTKQIVNHTAIIIRLHSYFTERVFVTEALSLVTLSPLSERLKRYKGHVYVSRLKPLYASYRKDIGRFVLLQAGKKYDYSGLAKQVFGHINVDLHRLFCSELATAAYQATGLLNGAKALWPGEFQKTGLFEEKERLF